MHSVFIFLFLFFFTEYDYTLRYQKDMSNAFMCIQQTTRKLKESTLYYI